jgi:penicillin-binding protein 1A
VKSSQDREQTTEPKVEDIKGNASHKLLKKVSQTLLKPFQGEKPLLERIKDNPLRHKSRKFWILTFLSLGLGSGAIAIAWSWYKLESSLPNSVDDVLTYTRPETLSIKAKDGTVLADIGPVTHDRLKIWEIPKQVQNAFIASEDSRFYQHTGVDYQGVLRAAVSNVLARDVVEGGSTITQQLARIVYLNQERSITRKLKEMRVAQNIDEKIGKDQILESYLNLVYLGSGAYGVADAAWVYFSKTPQELTLAETATLAGIVPAPSVYSPLENPQLAKERRDIVLKKMEEEGFITPAEKERAVATPLTVKQSQPKRLERNFLYFTEYIQKELPKYISKDRLKEGGIKVETTLDPQWQTSAENAVEKAVNTYGRYQRFSQAALVAIDPRNGQIKAMVGGKDFGKNQFNRVTQAKRQPGSTFKTFVYTTAIAAGFSPYRSYMDAQMKIDGYTPENYGDTYSNTSVSLITALTKSLNVIAVQTLLDVGWNPVIDTAKKMGIESELKPTYSLALGASEVTPLEITSAYGTLANQGVHFKAHGITRILDKKGNVIYENKSVAEEALDKDTASIMTWMLRNVVTSGTGTPAQIGRPVAGKTGTSDKARDLWFIGFIPQAVAGVWLGNDDNTPTYGASASAAATWRKFMSGVVDEIPEQKFPPLSNNYLNRKAVIKTEKIRPRRKTFYVAKKSEDGKTITSAAIDDTSSRSSRRRRRRSSQVNDANALVQTSTNNTSSSRRRRRTKVVESKTNNLASTKNNETNSRRSRRTRRSQVVEQSNTPAETTTKRSTRRRRSTANTTSTKIKSKRSLNNSSSSRRNAERSGSDSSPPAPPAARKQE